MAMLVTLLQESWRKPSEIRSLGDAYRISCIVPAAVPRCSCAVVLGVLQDEGNLKCADRHSLGNRSRGSALCPADCRAAPVAERRDHFRLARPVAAGVPRPPDRVNVGPRAAQPWVHAGRWNNSRIVFEGEP